MFVEHINVERSTSNVERERNVEMGKVALHRRGSNQCVENDGSKRIGTEYTWAVLSHLTGMRTEVSGP
jgi:hypothetical protein